jgi:endonuclease/exonuclease/phosphatase family metal-dependent hydrolase
VSTKLCWVGCTLVMWACVGKARATDPMRVMSFNVRYGTAADGDNRWDKRKELMVAAIRQFAPDVLGTQETLAFQAEYLSSQLPGFTRVGAGRDDGKLQGEQATIFFKADRFESPATGHYWLSEHPERPGIKGWDAACPRMVTWAKLRDRKSGRTFLWLNTHWDHRGAQARLESPRVMRRWLAEQASHMPVIITGDFNSFEDSPQYRILLGEGELEPKLIDTFRKLHPVSQAEEATFHDFTGSQKGRRIDWILVSPDFTPVEATIDRFSKDGRYPSDHFPVTATLR